MTESKRIISPADIVEWVGPTSAAKLSVSQYETIADRLTNFYWHGETQKLAIEENAQPDDRWWDFAATTSAARQLRDSIPKMVTFQDSLRWAPETREGYAAIKALEAALTVALPYVEWPLGEYTPVRGRKKAKDWHIYAVLIANIMSQELQKAGNSKTSPSRNSMVARVVLAAMRQMRIPQTAALSTSAIGAYLSRWNKQYGSPKASSVTTK